MGCKDYARISEKPSGHNPKAPKATRERTGKRADVDVMLRVDSSAQLHCLCCLRDLRLKSFVGIGCWV